MTWHYPRILNQIGKVILMAILLSLSMNLSPSRADDNLTTATQKETDAAVSAMRTWLGEVDAGDYAKSWGEASASFKKAVSSDEWVTAVTAARTPFGKMNERKLAGAIYQTGLLESGVILPGQFVIAQFDTSFEKIKSARETVTFEKEGDGAWRVSGYYIKPM